MLNTFGSVPVSEYPLPFRRAGRAPRSSPGFAIGFFAIAGLLTGCKTYTVLLDDGGDTAGLEVNSNDRAPGHLASDDGYGEGADRASDGFPSDVGSDLHSSSDLAPDNGHDGGAGDALDGSRNEVAIDVGGADIGSPPKLPASLHLSIAPGSSFEFGSLAVGVSPPQTEQFIVKNTGEQNSSVLTVSLAGTDFKLEPPTGLDCVGVPSVSATMLAPNASCTVRVTFSPTAVLSRTATLSVSATNGGSDSFSTLHGAGVMPSALTVSSPTVDFGTVLQGGKSNPATPITLRNQGGVTTGVISTSITAGEFAIGTDGCKGLALAPNASCVLSVVFSPLTANATVKTGTLTVSASPGGSPTVALSGLGITLALGPASFVFPATLSGTTSPPRSFTVTNSTSGPAGMTAGLSVTLAGPSPTDFHVDSTTCSGSLGGGGGVCGATVSFRPSTFGVRTATLTVSANAGGTVTAALSGEGQGADSTPGCVTDLDCQSGSCVTRYLDSDGDGTGDPKKPLNFCGFAIPPGYVATSLDCDDSDPSMNEFTSRCQSNTTRAFCLGDATLQRQTCPGGRCLDGYCVGSQNIAGSFLCGAPAGSGQLSTSLVCSAPQVCTWPTGAPSPACGASSAATRTAVCDDASDCGPGQVCCRLFQGAEYARSCIVGTCPPASIASNSLQLCNPVAPNCPTGVACSLQGFDIAGGQGFWECF